MKSVSPIWHPFTQHALQPEAIPIATGKGAWLETADGRRIFDAISSWWVVTHGHRHPHIVQAIKDQADRLDQVIFAGFTHEPAERLARQLIEITPPELEYVFFSDSGSTSVEVALKMALGFWRRHGEKRSRILALEGAYHGAACRLVNVASSMRLTIRCCSMSRGCHFLARVASRQHWRH
jgi:adenosylmethionine---8-amino-7-oxononanoate aminotransferase